MVQAKAGLLIRLAVYLITAPQENACGAVVLVAGAAESRLAEGERVGAKCPFGECLPKF